MTDLEKIKEMKREDSFLYRSIVDVLPSKSTDIHYKAFKKLHSQLFWSIDDIEKYAEE